MSVIINPGSHIGKPGEGWTNTYEQAEREAQRWLKSMIEHDHLVDVELLLPGEPATGYNAEGRWAFTFRHKVTGATAMLETHGIDNLDAYEKQHIFPPRVYWNGGSSSNPQLEDFAAEGFTPVATYVVEQ